MAGMGRSPWRRWRCGMGRPGGFGTGWEGTKTEPGWHQTCPGISLGALPSSFHLVLGMGTRWMLCSMPLPRSGGEVLVGSREGAADVGLHMAASPAGSVRTCYLAGARWELTASTAWPLQDVPDALGLQVCEETPQSPPCVPASLLPSHQQVPAPARQAPSPAATCPNVPARTRTRCKLSLQINCRGGAFGVFSWSPDASWDRQPAQARAVVGPLGRSHLFQRGWCRWWDPLGGLASTTKVRCLAFPMTCHDTRVLGFSLEGREGRDSDTVATVATQRPVHRCGQRWWHVGGAKQGAVSTGWGLGMPNPPPAPLSARVWWEAEGPAVLQRG